MYKKIQLSLSPHEAADSNAVSLHASRISGYPLSSISGITILKKSLDARNRNVRILLTAEVYANETPPVQIPGNFHFQPLQPSAKKIIIVGAGPAGLFAALRLIEAGIRPIILERGKDVRARRRDLAILNKEGKINPESNYCFGEGGAGTYSDGKLYTRSSKRGDVNRILRLFVYFGAEENILYESHPHIGTNKLPGIISAMRKQIIDCGGIFLFERKVNDFILDQHSITGVRCADGDLFTGEAVLLATGHSARDIFHLLDQKKIELEGKSFALGVRVEHPQDLIDSIQYHCPQRDPFLPPASYNLVEQVNNKGVFSFCMCPGGIIATASTDNDELVVNGWSPSKRNNPFANSGIVVSVEKTDLPVEYQKYGELAGLYFQQQIEKNAFAAGGGNFAAPAQRLVDFTENKLSASLPACSYIPGVNSARLSTVLPSFVFDALKKGFPVFGRKMKGYFTNDAVVVATESRTSSPVRIPRDPVSREHIRIKNLYPCGEGAGYAGGIVSAAMDGEQSAEQIIKRFAAKPV